MDKYFFGKVNTGLAFIIEHLSLLLGTVNFVVISSTTTNEHSTSTQAYTTRTSTNVPAPSINYSEPYLISVMKPPGTHSI